MSSSASTNGCSEVTNETRVYRCPYGDIDIPDITVHQQFFNACDQFKDAPALTEALTGKSVTYSELKEQVKRVAAGLHKEGFRKGDCVALFAGNSIDFTLLFLGSSCLGLCVSTANPTFTPMELNRHLALCDAVAVFTSAPLVSVVDKAVTEGEMSHTVKTKYVFGDSPGYTSFDSLKEHGNTYPDVTIDTHNDTFVLPFSSGTTGLPKGVMLTHRNLVSNVLQVKNAIRVSPGDNVLCLLPMYHIYGMVAINLNTLVTGGHVVYLPRFEPQSFLQCLQNYKIKFGYLVPPLIVFLSKHPIVSQFDISSMTHLASAAAHCGKEINDVMLKRHPNIEWFSQGYGLTETSPAICIDRKKQSGSVGQVVNNTLVRMVDPETGKDVPAGTEGEVWVKGPQVMKGYYKNKKATDDMIDSNGWLRTGDIAVYDEVTETFYIVDRLKELIKYKGSQVAPAELEALLLSHPDVDDAAVLGVPDEMAGELPKAFVVKKSTSDVTGEAIQQFVAERVAYSKKLRGGVQFVETIPKNSSGKILRRLIRDKYVR